MSLSQEKAFKLCKEKCPGPSKCPTGGIIFYKAPGGQEKAFWCPFYQNFRRQIEIEKRVMDSIPRRFWNRGFHNFERLTEDLSLAYTMALKFAESEAYMSGSNLIILGPYGVGKTHLAAAIARRAIEGGRTVAFVPAPHLSAGTLNDISDRFRAMKDADLIVIDDFSTELDHKALARELFALVNYRYEAEKGIVITSNLSPEAFREAVGDRIFDRLAERSVIVEIRDATSYRMRRRDRYIDWAR